MRIHRKTNSERLGFTVTELMVVVGLIAVLASLLVPVVSKVRTAANSARCAANLRQFGTGWIMYVAENHGQVPEYIWHTPATPNVAWNGYWLGILNHYGVNGQALICPAAYEPTGIVTSRGYGDAAHSWTGKYASNGSVVRFNDTQYREGSYGYNRYVTAGGGFAGTASTAISMQHAPQMPLFLDCVYADTMPGNGSPDNRVSQPPDLTGGSVIPGSPEHWKFLIARHGRGVNVCMADGSVAWVQLEDTYMLYWTNNWAGYSLTLPGT